MGGDRRILDHAHALVAAARKAGTLVPQPCEVCGSMDVVAHHDDYEKLLDVRWLCQSHHRLHHGQFGSAANAGEGAKDRVTQLTVPIHRDLLWDLKLAAVHERMTLQDYVVDALKEGLERDRGASR